MYIMHEWTIEIMSVQVSLTEQNFQAWARDHDIPDFKLSFY